MLNFLNVSVWPILIGGALNMILGMLWYGPFFGKKWMKLMGIDEVNKDEMQKSAGIGYFISIITALAYGYTMDLLINSLGINNLVFAILLGLLVIIGFQLPTAVKPLLWEDKPRSLFIINFGFEIAFGLLVSIGAFFL